MHDSQSYELKSTKLQIDNFKLVKILFGNFKVAKHQIINFKLTKLTFFYNAFVIHIMVEYCD
jgi:hypothetical protein